MFYLMNASKEDNNFPPSKLFALFMFVTKSPRGPFSGLVYSQQAQSGMCLTPQTNGSMKHGNVPERIASKALSSV